MMKDPCPTIQKIVTARTTPGGAIEVIQRIGRDYRPLCCKRKCEEAEQQLIEGLQTNVSAYSTLLNKNAIREADHRGSNKPLGG